MRGKYNAAFENTLPGMGTRGLQLAASTKRSDSFQSALECILKWRTEVKAIRLRSIKKHPLSARGEFCSSRKKPSVLQVCGKFLYWRLQAR